MARINDAYDIGAAFQAIENELIASMIRNMKAHKLEEVGENKQWSMWQAEQLKALEKYKRQNQKKYSGQFKDINSKIEALIRHSKVEGGMQQELEILEAIKNGFKGAKRASAGGAAEFFRLNERKLEALIKATKSDMQRAETAVLRMADDQYRKIIFNAQVYANTGAGTYEKAVDMATKDMLSSGLNCVEYKNGARHTLADYAEMAIRTASKRAYLQGEGEKRQEWGITTVIVNKRGNPCPKCLPFVGKVLIDDVWSGGEKGGKSPVTGLKYPLLSEAISAGLYHPRCKDSHTTYFEGISTPPDDKYTRDELDKIAEDYRKEQKEQYAKRQQEKFERLTENSLDPENQRKYKQHEQGWRRQFMRQQETEREEAFPETGTLFVPAKTKAEAEAFGKTYCASGTFSVTGDFRTEILNGFNEAADNVQKRFGRKLKIKGIGRVKAGDGRYRQAGYNPQTQIISLKNSSMKTYQENAEKNFASGWNASKDKYGTFYHEIGHAVWEDLPREARSEIREIYEDVKHKSYKKWMELGGSGSGVGQADVFGKELSRYAIENEREFFSEAFSQVMSGRMRPASRRTNEVLNKYFKKSVAKDVGSGIMKPKKEGLPKYLGEKIVKTDNQSVREWYYANVSDIPNQIDKTKSFDEQVKQAFELRNKYKHEARVAMSDVKKAQELEELKPAPGFEELVESKMKRKNMNREEALQDILKTASKTNPDVNKEFGL